MSITLEIVTAGLQKNKAFWSVTFEKVTEGLQKIKLVSTTLEKVAEGLRKNFLVIAFFEKGNGEHTDDLSCQLLFETAI